MKDSNLIWYCRAFFETNIQSGLLLLIWFFEKLGLVNIYILSFNSFINNSEVIILLILILFISLFITNLLFISLHRFRIVNVEIGHFIIGSFVSAFFESFTFLAFFWCFYCILNYFYLISLVFINPNLLLLIVFIIILVSNFLFNLLFKLKNIKVNTIIKL